MMKSGEDKLEMLIDGTKAGRDTIKNTAEECLTEISQSGVKHLKYELPEDALKRANEKPVVLNVAPNGRIQINRLQKSSRRRLRVA